MSMIPNVPNVPNISNVSNVPNISNVPNVSNGPNVPNVPNAPIASWKALSLALLLVGLFVVGMQAQQRGSASPAPGTVPVLTAQDYIDIQQLVSSYAYGLDGNTDNGESYAALFAPGAVFGRPRTEGRENLAKLANTQPHGAQYVRHFITNHVIDPAPGGAVGKEYAVIIDIGENGMPGQIALGGRYDDEYVKTPQGWKFKSRTFTPSRVDVQPAPAGGGRGGRGQQD